MRQENDEHKCLAIIRGSKRALMVAITVRAAPFAGRSPDSRANAPSRATIALALAVGFGTTTAVTMIPARLSFVYTSFAFAFATTGRRRAGATTEFTISDEGGGSETTITIAVAFTVVIVAGATVFTRTFVAIALARWRTVATRFAACARGFVVKAPNGRRGIFSPLQSKVGGVNAVLGGRVIWHVPYLNAQSMAFKGTTVPAWSGEWIS